MTFDVHSITKPGRLLVAVAETRADGRARDAGDDAWVGQSTAART